MLTMPGFKIVRTLSKFGNGMDLHRNAVATHARVWAGKRARLQNDRRQKQLMLGVCKQHQLTASVSTKEV